MNYRTPKIVEFETSKGKQIGNVIFCVGKPSYTTVNFTKHPCVVYPMVVVENKLYSIHGEWIELDQGEHPYFDPEYKITVKEYYSDKEEAQKRKEALEKAK